MRSLVTVLGAVLALVSPTCAADNQQFSLNTGTDTERIQKLVKLGVRNEDAEQAQIAQPVVIRWTALRGYSSQYAVLFIPCVVDSAFIYLMQKNGDSWKAVDRIEADCHYDGTVSLDIRPIRDGRTDELLLHHAGEGHGTGYSQQNFKVLEIAEAKLINVLDTEEVIRISRVPGPDDEDFDSVFVVVPSTKGEGVIEETRTAIRNQHLKVERRYFRWSAEKRKYVPTKFAAVKVR